MPTIYYVIGAIATVSGLIGTGLNITFKLGKIVASFEQIEKEIKSSNSKVTKAFEMLHEHGERIVALETVNDVEEHHKEKNNGRKYI